LNEQYLKFYNESQFCHVKLILNLSHFLADDKRLPLQIASGSTAN